jgi:hypothetical protein
MKFPARVQNCLLKRYYKPLMGAMRHIGGKQFSIIREVHLSSNVR